MLYFMRKHAKFFYVFFAIIIVSFIGFYAGPLDREATLPVAEVNKIKITQEEYWRAYGRARDFYRELYKEKFDEEMEKKLRLKEKVLDTLIEDRVLILAAKDLGISVNDEELQEAIMNNPSFTRNGVFDRDIYLKTLHLNRLTPEIFESAKREELTIIKMKQIIGESVDLTGDETKQLVGDEQAANALRQAILLDKRERAVKSYVAALKKQMKIKINEQLISS